MTQKNRQLPLFVYGTLQPGFSRYSLVRQWVERYERAYLRAFQMYDFRSFPGIVPSADSEPYVSGSLLYASTESWDDFIQQTDRVENEGFLFHRIEVSAALLSGVETEAWSYVVNPTALQFSASNIIKGNDWAAVYR